MQQLGRSSVDLEFAFKHFLDRNLRQYSRIKTLLNPGSPIPLDTAFEPPTLEVDDHLYNEDSFLRLLQSEPFIIITGTGGSGNSVLIKHLFIRYYNKPWNRIPILIEIRNLPDTQTILEYIKTQIQSVSNNFSDKMLEYALRSGKFVLLFDGFDEVDYDRRKSVADQIIGVTYSYGDNSVILTSRPDDSFAGWNEFTIAKMKGFNKNQVISIVKKMKYDKSIKGEFIRLIRDGSLYETHGSFLSNPLLCTIMLLTFDQGAEIPNKMDVFFGQTFDVLFYRHDATKGTSYRRKFMTALSIEDFRAAVAAFSAFSYVDVGPTMRSAIATIAANKALEYCRLTESASSFLNDLCSSVSLMVKEGDTYSYIHRKFQEYFVALFLVTREIG